MNPNTRNPMFLKVTSLYNRLFDALKYAQKVFQMILQITNGSKRIFAGFIFRSTQSIIHKLKICYVAKQQKLYSDVTYNNSNIRENLNLKRKDMLR